MSLREVDVEQQLCEVLDLISFDAVEMRDLRELGEEGRKDLAREEEKRKLRIRTALALCETRLSRLTDAYIDQVIDKEVFEGRKAALFGERRDLKDSLLDRPIWTASEELLEKFELGNLAKSLFSAKTADRCEGLDWTVSNLVADQKALGIRLRFPFDRVAEWRISNNGGPCCVGLRTEVTLSKKRTRSLEAFFSELIERAKAQDASKMGAPARN